VTRAGAVALGVIAAVAAIALLPHVARGGFMADDWIDNGQYLFHPGHGFGDAVRYSQAAPRDLWALLRMTEYAAFGTHPWPYLALTALASLAECALFFLLLRRLRAPAAPAAMAAVLLLVLPVADSARLWSSGLQITLFAGCFLLGGLLVALYGLELRGRRAVAVHALALLLYAISVNGYELGAPIILLAGLLYTKQAGWRAARWRWAADIVVVGAVLIRYSGRRGPVPGVSLSELIDNARDVGRSGLHVAARSLVPVDGVEVRQVVVAVLLLAVAALLVTRRGPQRREARLGAALVTGGTVLGAAGWTMFLTGFNGYSPEWPGYTNRVNAVAAFGIVIGIAGVAVLVAALIRAALRERAPAAPVLAALLLVPLAIAHLHHLRSDAADWDRAGREGRALLARLHELVPAPQPGTTLFTVRASGYTAPAVLVFAGATSQDLYWAVKVSYRRPDVAAFPALNGMTFSCGASAMAVNGTTPPSTTPYGKAAVVDVPARTLEWPRNRAECLRDTGRLRPYSTDYPVG
jgi:hypothetical protein